MPSCRVARRSIRQAAGRKTAAQVVGANLDVVFVVASLNADLNLRRLERYLAAAWDSGAEPVVILSKVDLDGEDEIAEALALVERAAAGTDRARGQRGRRPGRRRGPRSDRTGPDRRVRRLVRRREVDPAQPAGRRRGRRDGRDPRGRRAAATRRPVASSTSCPVAASILDTPGMRELALWDDDQLAAAFGDIDELAGECRWRNCRHEADEGCAIRAALADGRLDRRSPFAAGRSSSARRPTTSAASTPSPATRSAGAGRQIGKAVKGHMDAKYGSEGWR